MSPLPAVTGPVDPDELVRGYPPPWQIDAADLAHRVAAGRRVVVLDDDPTGTQSVADVPVLTAWSPPDLAWAFAQDTPGFFVLTNTRSLAEADAVALGEEIAGAVVRAGAEAGVDHMLVSRSDSTLRGHFPAETDVLVRAAAAAGAPVDGIVIVPAMIEPGRLTVGSVHWMRTPDGMIPVSHSEFARDATFGYTNADLRDWVAEKTGGRVGRGAVATVTLTDLRGGGPARVAEVLGGLTDAQPVVVDAATDDDLRVLVEGLLVAEAAGKRFVHRSGPSFVRARLGQTARAPLTAADLAATLPGADPADTRPAVPHGLVVAGSHVGLTTRQLDRLRAAGGTTDVELDVPTLLDPARREPHVRATAERAIDLLGGSAAPGDATDVVLRTSRRLVTGADADESLAIARSVSAAMVDVVADVVARVRPRFVVAKGGITSSDTATGALGVSRAWARGTLLPGIVSVWEPVAGPARGIPYVVFAGNVGDDDGLAGAVSTLRSLVTASTSKGNR
ncbi:four-carbon acid sugar kinase family protein [Pseudonocardia sp. N23]|uniref:four-carbon acid sugar kinase family protein n=1 Tax=Pseudonocardia sp. N23 TaxID=1987376 RepID=UPI000BFCDA79|nr:four-carbon acid sugar kinase family protein [Pseudonocardia sp. N23]GAY11463.1 hypothetical protein TOK_5973 [Pseudonocardia sp. N23]